MTAWCSDATKESITGTDASREARSSVMRLVWLLNSVQPAINTAAPSTRTASSARFEVATPRRLGVLLERANRQPQRPDRPAPRGSVQVFEEFPDYRDVVVAGGDDAEAGTEMSGQVDASLRRADHRNGDGLAHGVDTGIVHAIHDDRVGAPRFRAQRRLLYADRGQVVVEPR